MASINIKRKEIEIKIVYYGPLRGGKTANLEYLFKACKKFLTGEMISHKTEGDRTLFFDFVPMNAGKANGYDVRLQIYTVPGALQYNSIRLLVLRETDGVVFVADSLAVRHEKNILLMKELEDNLRHYDISIFKIPLVLQYNKRDLRQRIPEVRLMPVEEMETALNGKLKAPSFDAIALTGYNVFRTLKTIVNMVLISVRKQFRLL